MSGALRTICLCLLLAACGHGSVSSSTGATSASNLDEGRTESGARADTATVRAGVPHIVGTMRPTDVRDVVDDRDPQVRACWRGLAWRLHETRNVGVLGITERLVLSWNIQSDGSITQLQRTGGTVDDSDFNRCVIAALQTLRFGRNGTGGVSRVEYTYDLISD